MLGGNGPISDSENHGSASSFGQSDGLGQSLGLKKGGGWKGTSVSMARPSEPAAILGTSLSAAAASDKSMDNPKSEPKDDSDTV
jgi:hypothetical protein